MNTPIITGSWFKDELHGVFVGIVFNDAGLHSNSDGMQKGC